MVSELIAEKVFLYLARGAEGLNASQATGNCKG